MRDWLKRVPGKKCLGKQTLLIKKTIFAFSSLASRSSRLKFSFELPTLYDKFLIFYTFFNIFIFIISLFLSFICLGHENPSSTMEKTLIELSNLPVLYKGRFRPLEAYSRLWLEDIYGAQHLDKDTLKPLGWENPSAVYFLWHLHFWGIRLGKTYPSFQ